MLLDLGCEKTNLEVVESIYSSGNPSPGNVAGGLLNITVKSLGAIAKGGTTRVEGVVEYAETPRNRGLNLMQGPGYDQESTPGLVAAGATIIALRRVPARLLAMRLRLLSSWRRTLRSSRRCRAIWSFHGRRDRRH